MLNIAIADLTITIPAADIPAPGEDVLINLDGPYQALIVNTGEPQETVEIDEPPLPGEPRPAFHYEVVDVSGAIRTHAAIVRVRGNRTVVNRWSLCSQSNSRRVTGRKRDQDLSTVTCAQCRRRLEAEGEL